MSAGLMLRIFPDDTCCCQRAWAASICSLVAAKQGTAALREKGLAMEVDLGVKDLGRAVMREGLRVSCVVAYNIIVEQGEN